MAVQVLGAQDLRCQIDPAALGFEDTRSLTDEPLPWIGQARAQAAAQFGLAMDQPGYNLLVVGEVGTGRTTLMREAMQQQAAHCPAPPDLCYLHNFDAPGHPRALRLPAGQGRVLRQALVQLVRRLQAEIPRRLSAPDVKAESARIEATYKQEEAQAYAALSAFADERHFSLMREQDHLVFTYRDASGEPLTAGKAMALSREQRTGIDNAEAELRSEISRFLERTRAMEHVMNEGLAALRRQMIKPWLDEVLLALRTNLHTAPNPTQPPGLAAAAEADASPDAVKLATYLAQVQQDVLENLPLFSPGEDDEDLRQAALQTVLDRLQVNLVVDNHGLQGAPVIQEDNPLFRPLFGSIEYASDGETLVTDFSRIRAGSLLRAHGGFLLLHLRDLVGDAPVWEKLRRVVRSGRLQIEEPSMLYAPIAAVSLEPEPVEVAVKMVLVASPEEYALVQVLDPEFARCFRCKVDFAETFVASEATAHATAVLVARLCQHMGSPHLQAAAVAELLADSHRQASHQHRHSARFDRVQSLVTEAGALARARGATLTTADDVRQALHALTQRHNAPEERWLQALQDGEHSLQLQGVRVGRVHGLVVVELADHRFGSPVQISAQTHAGEDGVLNIEREVELSGPLHDKAVLILTAYLQQLLAPLAPLALNASLVMEQEHAEIEGDSAAAAECVALLSSLAGVPVAQGLALTGALGSDGALLPVGGINEKVEGFYRACVRLGLDGQQGVIVPARNRQHLMLAPEVVAAVEAGRFRVLMANTLGDALQQMTGLPLGERRGGGYTPGSVLARAQRQLLAFRQACAATSAPATRPGRGASHGKHH